MLQSARKKAEVPRTRSEGSRTPKLPFRPPARIIAKTTASCLREFGASGCTREEEGESGIRTAVVATQSAMPSEEIHHGCGAVSQGGSKQGKV